MKNYDLARKGSRKNLHGENSQRTSQRTSRPTSRRDQIEQLYRDEYKDKNYKQKMSVKPLKLRKSSRNVSSSRRQLQKMVEPDQPNISFERILPDMNDEDISKIIIQEEGKKLRRKTSQMSMKSMKSSKSQRGKSRTNSMLNGLEDIFQDEIEKDDFRDQNMK